MVLPPNELLHIGPNPSGAGWNHFNLGLGLTSHVDYAQSTLGNSPPQGQPWFYSRTNPTSGKDVGVFSAPLGGATTSSNTQYSRCELRGFERDGTTKMAFDPTSGDHWIEGIYRIYGLSGLTKPGVCVQQYHDPNDDVMMVRTELSSGATKLQVKFNGNQVATLNSSYVDGTEFYLKMRINAGTPEVYYTTNLASIPSTPTYTSAGYFSGASTGWYEKTGSYNQTNESTDPNVDPDASIIKVEIRELKTWHSTTPAGGAWPTPATYAVTGSPSVDAGPDASILPTGTFTRTATVTLNGASLSSQEWKILSGPFGVGNVLDTDGTITWNPSDGTTTTGTTTRGLGVGGIPKPAAASNVELNGANRGDMNITASGTALVPRIYDGGGFTCGRITVSADYIIIQNYNIRPNSQYAFYCTGSNVTLQNCDIKNVSVSGDGDLNAITLLEGSNIDILYNTSVNYVSGDPGSSHTDWIQTWVSSSHPTPVSNVRVIGNKATGPSNPSRSNSVASIHQCIMVESAGHGGNSGGSGTPSNWTVLENEFGDSWGQSIKTDCGNNFVFARNNWVGSSDNVFELTCGTGNVVYSSNTFGSGYGSVGASITSGNGPANPISGGTTTTTTPYPEGTYVLQYTAVTSAGTVTDTVTVTVTSTPGGGGGVPTSTYPSIVSVGTAAKSDGSGTVTVPAPAGVTSSHFQICVIQDPGTESFTAVPSGWSLLDDEAIVNSDFGQPGGDSSTFIFYNTTGDNQTRSWTKSGTRGYHAVRMAWKDYSGLGQHLSRASSYTTTPYAPPVTPTINKALVVTVMGSDRTDIGPSPVSVPTGWVERYNAGQTVNVNEIQWIAVAEIQVDNRAVTGANVPTGTGLGTSNFHLTNADNGAMFSFVLEGVIDTGTTTGGAVSLVAQPRLTLTLVGGGSTRVGAAQLTVLPALMAWPFNQASLRLQISTTLNAQSVVFPRGTYIIIPNLTVGIPQQVQLVALNLIVTAVLRAGALPYRKPVIRTDYKYPPRDHPFRLIAQRILDGEIVEWELPVAEDFEYVEQLSGPIVMHGSFRPELISVQELGLDGYAYWLHVEIQQEIRASAILLPPQYEESAMTFSAEGVAAAPHYHYYDNIYSQIQVDPLSVVRTLWNYVQAQPQSDYGVVVSQNSSPVRIGAPATTETTVTDNGDGTTTTTIRDIPAKPYELNWWDAKNVGEEIDSLAGQTPFDYVERHQWNSDRTDVLHFIDLAYPRVGSTRSNLLFNEENILEVVPVQESEDTYASAVLVIGAGDGADTIRAYRAAPFADRVRKEVVITDKSITSQAVADSRADQELALRRGRAFEVGELVINAYHTNAPIGTYRVGDDVQVQVDIPWLMVTHTAWYRITSISNKPSSDKVRLGMARSATLLDTSDTWIPIDDYVPFEPPPVGPITWQGLARLIVFPQLTFSGPTAIAFGSVSMIVTKTISVIGTPVPQATVILTATKTLTANGIATGTLGGTTSLNAIKTLTVGAQVRFESATTMTVSATLGVGVVGAGADPFGAAPFGAATAIQVVIGFISLSATTALSIVGPVVTLFSGVPLNIVPTLGATPTPGVGGVTLTASSTLSTNGTIIRSGAVSLSATKTLSAGANIPTGGATGFGSDAFGANPFGGAAIPINLSVPITLTAGAFSTRIAAISLSVGKTLTASGTVSSTVVTPVIRATATGNKSITGDTSVTVTKPTGLAVGDYILAIQLGDADTTAANMNAPAGWGASLASQTGNATSNYPTFKIYGKVATSTETAATNFVFNASDVGDGVVALIAIQTGTYSSATPVTMAGSFTTQARTSLMTQTAPSMTGVINGLLMALFGTDTNNNSESYPVSGPASMTRQISVQGTPLYALLGVYSQVLSSTAATGTKTVSPSPSGITTNGWTTTSLIVNPG